MMGDRSVGRDGVAAGMQVRRPIAEHAIIEAGERNKKLIIVRER